MKILFFIIYYIDILIFFGFKQACFMPSKRPVVLVSTGTAKQRKKVYNYHGENECFFTPPVKGEQVIYPALCSSALIHLRPRSSDSVIHDFVGDSCGLRAYS